MGAFGQGFSIGLNSGARGGDKHADLTDEERETALGGYNESIKSIQDKMSQDPGNAAAYQSQLSQVVADRTDLFHPRHGPGALAHLGRQLWESVHGKQPQQPQAPPQTTIAPNPAQQPDMRMPDGTVLPAMPSSDRPTINIQTPADAKQRMAQDLGFGAGLPQDNKFQALHKQLVSAGLSEDDAMKAVRVSAGLDPKPVAAKPTEEAWKRDGQPFKGADGKWYERQSNKGGELRDQPLSDNFQPPSNVKKTQFDREMGAFAASLGKNIDDLTFEEYQTGLARIKQAVTPTTHSTRDSVQQTQNGDLVVVPLSSTNSKTFPGGGRGAASAPSTSEAGAPPKEGQGQTPAKLRSKAQATRKAVEPASAPTTSSTATPGGEKPAKRVVGHRNTPAQVAADKDMETATKLKTLADDAWREPSAASDRQLALSIIRGTAGRVNIAEFNIYTKKYGWNNTLEAFANNATSGELPTEIRRQLVKLAHENLKGAKAGHDEAFAGTAGAQTDPNANKPDPNKTHSLKTAMGLKFNQGKTEAQVRADLEAHGYTVIP